jgi:hypothetical protein
MRTAGQHPRQRPRCTGRTRCGTSVRGRFAGRRAWRRRRQCRWSTCTGNQEWSIQALVQGVWDGRSHGTYGVALVAVAGELALTTAELDACVLVGLAPRLAVVRGHTAGRDRAAGDGCVGGGVLRGREAGKGRGGDDDGGVEHCCGIGQSINA